MATEHLTAGLHRSGRHATRHGRKWLSRGSSSTSPQSSWDPVANPWYLPTGVSMMYSIEFPVPWSVWDAIELESQPGGFVVACCEVPAISKTSPGWLKSPPDWSPLTVEETKGRGQSTYQPVHGSRDRRVTAMVPNKARHYNGRMQTSSFLIGKKNAGSIHFHICSLPTPNSAQVRGVIMAVLESKTPARP